MREYKLAIMVGSLRTDSHNLKLAKAIQRLAKDKFKVNILRISDIPLYNQDLETDFPKSVLRLKNEIEKSDGVIFITPEYNRGISAPLKNAIDWGSRPYQKNSFSKKPAAICGTSVGAIGTACAQYSLKNVLCYLDVSLMTQPEVYLQFKENLIGSDGNINVSDTKSFLQGFVDKFHDWISITQGK